MNPGFTQDFDGDAHIITVENDANLAAIAERASVSGRGRDVSSYISLLVGEGIGSGLMIDGRESTARGAERHRRARLAALPAFGSARPDATGVPPSG